MWRTFAEFHAQFDCDFEWICPRAVDRRIDIFDTFANAGVLRKMKFIKSMSIMKLHANVQNVESAKVEGFAGPQRITDRVVLSISATGNALISARKGTMLKSIDQLLDMFLHSHNLAKTSVR